MQDRRFGRASLKAAWLAPLPMLGLVWAASAQPAGSNDPLPPGPGHDLVAGSCSQCHALGTAIAKRRTPEDWTGILQRMIGMGAQIDDAQFRTIQTYLAANFAEQPGTAAPPPVVAAAAGPARSYPRPSGPNQWSAYGGGDSNLNYSPLSQITPKNVTRLKQAWAYHYGAGQTKLGDQGLDVRFEVTPLLIGGIMYISTPTSPLKPELKSSITALEPETGKVLWKYETPANVHGRGLAYWPGDATTAPRLIFGTDGGYIMAIDVTTGRPARGFGRGGRVDGYIGVASEMVGETRRSTFTIPNPISVYKDLFITAARPGEVGPPGPRGDIRGWDVKTGRLVWTFHVVPQPGEANHETYRGDEWRDISGANVWSSMSLDPEHGILYAPTGDLNADARGPNLYASTLLALDAATGKLIWHHQITHHDIWDWDSPTPPMLIDLPQDGKTVPAVAITGKHGLFFLFDRLTGAPLNGFTERPTPQPSKPSDDVWPTQPFPDAPGPVARTQMTRDEVADVVPGMKAFCQSYWDENKVVSEPLYGPRQSSDHAVITYPGPTGGPNWGGGSYIPDLGLYFVNVQNRAVYRPKAPPGAEFGMSMHASVPDEGQERRAFGPPPQRGPRGAPAFSFKAPDGAYLSCGATPWGELVAVDVNKRRIAWRSPLGTTPALGRAGLTTGSSNLGGSIATKSGLVFIGASNDRIFHAYDARTGKLLWQTTLEASAHATPISYMGKDGKQYVVVAAGGGTSVGGPEMSDAIVAYSLP